MNDSPWRVVVSMKMQRSSMPADYIHGIGLYECPLSTTRDVMRQVEAELFCPSGRFVQLLKFYTTLFRNPLTGLKDDNVTPTRLLE